MFTSTPVNSETLGGSTSVPSCCAYAYTVYVFMATPVT